MEPPSEATLTVYGCQGGSGTVELRAGSITGRLLDSITITVRTPTPTPTPVTPSGELSATKTSIGVGETVTVSAVNVSPSGQSVYIVTNGRLDFARPGTCHFEIGPRSSEKSTRSWTLEGCSPPGSGSVTLKTRHNGQTLVLDSITIDVSSAPTPTHTPTTVPTATTTDPVVVPPATTTDPVDPCRSQSDSREKCTTQPTSTPTPGVLNSVPSFATTTMSVVFHRGVQVSEPLPEAQDGEGPLHYSISPSLGNGLRFDLGTRSIVGTPTDAANTEVYTYEASDGTGDSVTMEVRVTVFDVSVDIGGWWQVLEYRGVRIRSGITSSQVRARIPASTGFQVDSDSCTWPHPTTANWSAWVWEGGRPTIVRCALGDGGTARIDIQVQERTRQGTIVHDLTVAMTIPEALHRADNQVRYYLPPASELFPAAKPAHLSSYPHNPLLHSPTVYVSAWTPWTRVVPGMVGIGSVAPSSTADVIVMGYWNPNPGPGSDRYCKNSAACVVTYRTDSHLTKATLYIEDPPNFGSSLIPKRWLLSYSDWDSDRETYAYLPGVLMHEFGHTLGLRDTRAGGYAGVMEDDERHEVPTCISAPPDKCGLSADDRNALKAIYQNHTLHR